MAAPGPSATDAAATKARTKQLAARTRVVKEADRLLVVDGLRNPAENLVIPISSNVLKDKILHLLIGDASPNFARLPGAKKAERTVMSQDSCMVTECNYPAGFLTYMLPGGAAVIDHLAAWFHDMSGWDSLLPIVNKLQTMRVPKLSPSYFRDVFKLDLALADKAVHKDAARWLRRKQKEHRQESWSLQQEWGSSKTTWNSSLLFAVRLGQRWAASQAD
jgi:hypothetical protein